MKLKINQIKITVADTVQNTIGTEYRLVGMRPYYKYENKVKTDTIEGYSFEVVLMNKGFEKINVKVPGVNTIEPFIDAEELSNGIPIELKGVELSAYARANNNFVNYELTAMATEIKLRGGDVQK